MDSIFGMDVESLFSTYGEKYTHEIELLTQMIEICLLEGSIYHDQHTEMLISSLKKRIILNCTIEKYQDVVDDIEILLCYNIKLDKELARAWVEAELALVFQKAIMRLEEAQNKYGHNFRLEIRNLKSFDVKKWIEENDVDD